jgi:vitamin K-dependent gamma-carboxylase-like protein
MNLLRTTPRAGALFAAMWALACLIDETAVSVSWSQQYPIALTVFSGFVVVAAIATIVRPESGRRLVVLATLSMTSGLIRFPVTPNHHFLTTTMNLVIVSAAIRHVVLSRVTSFQTSELYPVIAPIGRALMIAVYLISGLHKANLDYLDPAVSCAAELAHTITQRLHVPDVSLFAWLSAYGSLGFECTVPLLLAFRRTRHLGIAIGLPVHFIFALDYQPGIFGFSATILAIYALFMAEDVQAAITAGSWIPRGRRLLAGSVGVVTLSVILTIIFSPAAVGHWTVLTQHPISATSGLASVLRVLPIGARFIWLLFAFTLTFAFMVTLRDRVSPPIEDDPVRRVRVSRLAFVFVPIVILNGLGPYLGYKTAPVFSMFSNLRTESEYSNHLFLTPLNLFPLADDLVTIADSSDPDFRAVAGRVRITAFELRRVLSGHGARRRGVLAGPELARRVMSDDFWVSYTRHGKTVRIARQRDASDEMFQGNAWVLEKLLYFRDLPIDNRPVCLW